MLKSVTPAVDSGGTMGLVDSGNHHCSNNLLHHFHKKYVCIFISMLHVAVTLFKTLTVRSKLQSNKILIKEQHFISKV